MKSYSYSCLQMFLLLIHQKKSASVFNDLKIKFHNLSW